MKLPYDWHKEVILVNVSAPDEWVREYSENGYLRIDPVFIELDRRIKSGNKDKYISWDFCWELTSEQLEVLERRHEYGLHYGFAAMEYNRDKDAGYMISLSSRNTEVKPCMRTVMDIVLPHMNIARMRLDVLNLVTTLSSREEEVSRLLCTGMTNNDIAKELNISLSTA